MPQIAVYLRVSTRRQDTRSQEPDLKRWLDAFANGSEVRWYRDHATGKSMDRPGWKKLDAELDGGNVSQVVVWRLDRLGRTASGLTALFEKLVSRRVGLVSLKDGFDLSTAAGRLMANLLASVASFELELRAERVLAGQAAARAAGKRWGGSGGWTAHQRHRRAAGGCTATQGGRLWRGSDRTRHGAVTTDDLFHSRRKPGLIDHVFETQSDYPRDAANARRLRRHDHVLGAGHRLAVVRAGLSMAALSLQAATHQRGAPRD